MKINVKRLLIIFAIAAVLAFGAMCLGGLFSTESTAEIFRVISDGLFAVGALSLGVMALIWIGNDGTFDSLSFTFKTLMSLKWSVFGNYREHYAEYKMNRKKKEVPIELLIVGVLLIAVAIGFLILFYRQ